MLTCLYIEPRCFVLVARVRSEWSDDSRRGCTQWKPDRFSAIQNDLISGTTRRKTVAELEDRLVVLYATFPATPLRATLLSRTLGDNPWGALPGCLVVSTTSRYLRRQGLPLRTKIQAPTRGRDREFENFVHRQDPTEVAFRARQVLIYFLGHRQVPIVRVSAAYGLGTA